MARKNWGVVLLIPIVLLYVVLIFGGLYNVIIESLGYIPKLGFNELSLKYYYYAISKNGFFLSIFNSIYLATISTCISLLVGVLIAFNIVQSKNVLIQFLVKKLMQIGLVIPYLYMIFIVVLFFSKSGVFSRLLYSIGIINKLDSFPGLLYNPASIGIILVFVFKGIPFVTLLVLNIMININDNYNDVARTLGCSKLKTLQKIYLPLCSNVIVWSSMVLFAYNLGSYEVPFILGSLKPKSYSRLLFSSYQSPKISNIPITMAETIILFLIGIFFVIFYAALINKILRGKKT